MQSVAASRSGFLCACDAPGEQTLAGLRGSNPVKKDLVAHGPVPCAGHNSLQGNACISGGTTCTSNTVIDANVDKPTVIWVRQIRFRLRSLSVGATYELDIGKLVICSASEGAHEL